MIAYKFLGSGAVGLYSGFRWPTPTEEGPGAWVDVDGPLVLGSNGVHACAPAALPGWIDDELWTCELAEPVHEHDGVLLAGRGRLAERVTGWSETAARAFTEGCVSSARDAAVAALRRAGAMEEAARLARLDGLDELQVEAAASARRSRGFARETLALVADAVELACGGRPDRYGVRPDGPIAPTAGAVAANLGFVTAHAVGCFSAGEAGDPAGYEAGFASERNRQRAWLAEHVLDAGGSSLGVKA